jgi:hypothetical protein
MVEDVVVKAVRDGVAIAVIIITLRLIKILLLWWILWLSLGFLVGEVNDGPLAVAPTTLVRG